MIASQGLNLGKLNDSDLNLQHELSGGYLIIYLITERLSLRNLDKDILLRN